MYKVREWTTRGVIPAVWDIPTQVEAEAYRDTLRALFPEKTFDVVIDGPPLTDDERRAERRAQLADEISAHPEDYYGGDD